MTKQKFISQDKRIRLFHGDCLDIMPKIPDSYVDLILCDLPYGTTANKWDVQIDLHSLWIQYKRCIKDNGAILLFSQGRFTHILYNSNPKQFRYDLVWDKKLKSGFLNAKRMPLRQHESVLIFYNKPPVYNPQFTTGKPNNSNGVKDNNNNNNKKYNNNNYGEFKATITKQTTDKYPTSIMTFEKVHPSKTVHPTQKPTELLEYLIRTYSNKNATVMDNTMGSGSTGVACINTNRRFIGIEMDETIYNTAVKRIKEAHKCKNNF